MFPPTNPASASKPQTPNAEVFLLLRYVASERTKQHKFLQVSALDFDDFTIGDPEEGLPIAITDPGIIWHEPKSTRKSPRKSACHHQHTSSNPPPTYEENAKPAPHDTVSLTVHYINRLNTPSSPPFFSKPFPQRTRAYDLPPSETGEEFCPHLSNPHDSVLGAEFPELFNEFKATWELELWVLPQRRLERELFFWAPDVALGAFLTSRLRDRTEGREQADGART
ncbi:hypothetical protein MBLNU230_g5120t1 [Neophaeotheca triangularis]